MNKSVRLWKESLLVLEVWKNGEICTCSFQKITSGVKCLPFSGKKKQNKKQKQKQKKTEQDKNECNYNNHVPGVLCKDQGEDLFSVVHM